MIPHHDHRLQVGFIALEQRLITRAQLSEAIARWLEDMNRPLSEILLLSNLITSQQLEAIEKSETSPEALKSTEEIEETLQLAGRSARGAEHTPTLRSAPRRYVFLRHHAQGGLGQVSIALDSELNRVVALKEILPHRADDAESQRRFIAEGEITGQLEHPGIVPVYGLGADPERRPYYAMRFVKGENLKQAIERFHQGRGRHDKLVGERALELRKLLGRFVDICNTIEYAHSRRVLHRDLKPENILLGRYGETLVVDWGLAKWLGETKVESEGKSTTTEMRLRGGSGSDTVVGEAMGTPAYMSPEQAEGNVQQLGRSSDIYSLGATLSVLLTGQAPVEGSHALEILARVRRYEIVRPREVWSAIPLALEAICLKAMAVHPWARYSSARELAEDIERWLADEPVKAYVEPITTKAKRWLRRHPVIVSTTTVCTMLGLAAALGMAYLQGAHATELRRKNGELAVANGKEQLARAEEEAARKDAEQKRARAESITEFFVNNIRLRNPFADGATLSVADSIALARMDVELDKRIHPLDKAKILVALSDAFGGLGKPAEELEAARAATQILSRVEQSDAQERLAAKTRLAKALASGRQMTEATRLFEEAIEEQTKLFGAEHSIRLMTQSMLAEAYAEAGDFARAMPIFEELLKKSQKAYGEEDETTLEILRNLALAQLRAGRPAEASKLLERVYDSDRRRLGERHARSLASKRQLATALQLAGEADRARPLYRESIESMKVILGDDHPSTLKAQNDLAASYSDAGQFDEAIALHHEVLRIRIAKLGANHPDTLTSQNNLAYALQDANRNAEAVPLFEATLAAERTTKGIDHPETLITQTNLASAYRRMERFDLAIPLLETTHTLMKAKPGPEHPDTLTCGMNLAIYQRAAGKLSKAVELMASTLDTMRKMEGEDAKRVLEAKLNYGSMLLENGQREKATEVLTDYVERGRKQAGDDRDAWWNITVAAALEYHGYQHFADSERLFREATEKCRELEPNTQRCFSTMAKLGESLQGQAKYDEAVKVLSEAFNGFESLSKPTPSGDQAKLIDLAQRICECHESMGNGSESAKWREKIRELQNPPFDPSK